MADAPAPICYLEIPAPDLGKAGTFYHAVFGWTVAPSGDYRIFRTGENSLEGGLDPRKPVVDGGILIYLKVADIPATLDEVRAAGGSVVQEKTQVGPEWGFFAIFRDPNGNRVGLWSRT
ncbi:MAG: VOC family protein [Planctomycetes bacterium]|nr:VOC family protein [Planctomycetota bacterium]